MKTKTVHPTSFAQAALRRIAEREQTCTLNRVNYSALSPVERLALNDRRKNA